MTEKQGTTRKMIVIGAGLAGLSAGCYAQMNGYDSCIVEQHTRAGGVCTSWKRKGYVIDGGLYWLMGSKPGSPFYRVYRELGALEGNRIIHLDRLGRFASEDSGQSLEITSDLDRLAADMRALSPQDGRAIAALIEGTRAFETFDLTGGEPVVQLGIVRRLKRMWNSQRWLKYAIRYRAAASMFAERFESPFLRWTVTSLSAPETPMVWLLILLAQLAAGELATIEGGSLNLALSVAQRYRELGGQVHFGASVQEVLVQDDKAVGVRLADGTVHRADIVVSTADGYDTVFSMLRGRYTNAAVRRMYESWPLFRPILLISFGVRQSLSAQPSESIIKLRDPLDVAGHKVGTMRVRVGNLDPTLAASEGTVVQVTLETEFGYWQGLSCNRARYEAEKARVAVQVLDRLESHLPGISAHVEMTDVATPHTFWRYTRNRCGAYRGWLLTPKQIDKTLCNGLTRPVPKRLPGLESFYMAGHWIEPGGGIPAALISGRQVVQLVCDRDGKPFLANRPAPLSAKGL